MLNAQAKFRSIVRLLRMKTATARKEVSIIKHVFDSNKRIGNVFNLYVGTKKV